jgi:cytochrome c556
MKHPILAAVVTVPVLAAALWLGGHSTASSADPNTATIMREKLVYSQEILRGITVEDFEAIQVNAQKLSRLSHATGWYSRQTPEYELFTAELRRHTDGLAKAAKARNVDAATLSYMQLTMNCVACHKYIRGAKTASLR